MASRASSPYAPEKRISYDNPPWQTFRWYSVGSETTGKREMADFSSYADSEASFHLFSIAGISAFFMTSGWMGYLCLTLFKYGLKISAITAFASGVLAMFVYAFVFAKLKKLDNTPEASLDELAGKTGKAYLNFAPKGISKIQIEFNSKEI